MRALGVLGLGVAAFANIVVGLTIAGVIAAPVARADEPLQHCAYRAAAGRATTCPFAENVRSAWFGQPGNPVLAYSPVTGEFYRMMCVRGFDVTLYDTGQYVTGATRCVDADGGDAVVYVW